MLRLGTMLPRLPARFSGCAGRWAAAWPANGGVTGGAPKAAIGAQPYKVWVRGVAVGWPATAIDATRPSDA